MFDLVLYPVSAILWCWHTLFSGLPPAAAWSLSIVFLVFTVRALLVKPAINQLRAAQRARELAPKVEKLRARYGRDRQRFAREVQKLHADAGTSPFAGCLPALIQLPVFLGLYWVLRGFTEGAESNQVFDRAAVADFVGADLFGAPLGDWIAEGATPAMLAVGGVLMVVAATATFLTMRASLRRQPSSDPRFATVGRAMLVLAPVGIVTSGAFFPVPIAVLLYFAVNNVWSLAQQHILA
ncbi:membrane protein insertase YidC [Actinophytocola gossypii]|uniref:Membrane protein insertase YidC n=1 Tax=Actinophytocola gossypii TaxID=2812003 RepID=A0ABT2J7V2_9PSEU|nr:membrane protein insertase YidC [Actinophytocola gossypii]MCT2583937.1 membrane protein insertase YidC [Actinophytocola gossypii]